MALQTRSQFYFGQLITNEGIYIDFSEGGPALTAVLVPNYYSPEQFCLEVTRAMNAAGALTYSCTFNRTTRIITLAASGVFSILKSTGPHAENPIYVVLGMIGGDVSGASSYTFSSPSGLSYRPQFYLLDYLAPEDNSQAIDGTINKSAGGVVEVVKYGLESCVELTIDFVNNDPRTDDQHLEQDLSAVENLRTFMSEVIQKANIEFMPDRDDPSVFYTIQIERTQSNQLGLGYRIREKTSQGFVGYYTTGLLTFRIVE
jgi:hypothetical protein